MIHQQLHKRSLLDVADERILTGLPCFRAHHRGIDFEAKLVCSLHSDLRGSTWADRTHQQKVDIMWRGPRFAGMPRCPGSENEGLVNPLSC